ncbi:MAG: transporter substrate-binding domain-containing protein [Gammaproteobacteria bacterium]|nr:transporter substrate-binding domain-containing protein [Gammaproteobacteria bacterium]
MEKRDFLKLLATSAVAGSAGALTVSSKQQLAVDSAMDESESTYDRIMREGKIRCGYYNAKPLIHINPNTGEFSGYAFDCAKRIADLLGVELETTEEIGLESFMDGLKTNRFDMTCGTIWPSVDRAKHVDFTSPLAYVPVLAVTRADDHRFSKDLNTINDPSVVISTLDGEMAQTIAAQDFPRAKILSVPQLTPFSDVLLNITHGKADITFAAPAAVYGFLENHPGSLQFIHADQPLRLFSETFAIRENDDKFQRLLNQAVQELLDSGFVDKTFEKYDLGVDSVYRVDKPFLELN